METQRNHRRLAPVQRAGLQANVKIGAHEAEFSIRREHTNSNSKDLS